MKKKVKAVNVCSEGVELDFGPYWSNLIVPINSQVNRKMKIKQGDNLEVVFRRRK